MVTLAQIREEGGVSPCALSLYIANLRCVIAPWRSERNIPRPKQLEAFEIVNTSKRDFSSLADAGSHLDRMHRHTCCRSGRRTHSGRPLRNQPGHVGHVRMGRRRENEEHRFSYRVATGAATSLTSRAPSSKARRQSSGKCSLRLAAFFSSSKRSWSIFE